MNGNGKSHGEGNVHVARWRLEFSEMQTADLLKLWERCPSTSSGIVPMYFLVARNELHGRGVDA